MEIQVKCRSEKRKDLISYAANYYAKKLNLNKSTFLLTIKSVDNLRKDKNCNGVVFQSGYRDITMYIDRRLSFFRLLLTLAHEMVHVKQIARGQYRGKFAKNGRVLTCWMGKTVRAEYMDRPWEKEAFGREFELVKLFVNRSLKNYLKKV